MTDDEGGDAEELEDHDSLERRQPLAYHLAQSPSDKPDLAAVVRRRVSGTDHPAARNELLVIEAARRYARRHPGWASSGEVDRAVDQVLEEVSAQVHRAGSSAMTSDERDALQLPLDDADVRDLRSAARLHARGSAWFDIDADLAIEILADEVLSLRAELRELRASEEERAREDDEDE